MNSIFSGENAYNHLKMLTVDIGPRHGGSKNEKKAAKYIEDYFKGLGLKTRLESYPIYSFKDAEAELTIPRNEEKIPCIAIPMTASTPTEGITKKVIFLEEAAAAYLDESVTDKIVVTFDSFAGDVQDRFHSYKAAALVSIQTQSSKSHFRGTYNSVAKRKIGSIPSVRLTLDDGRKLIHNLPEKMTLKVDTQEEKVTTGHNVIADMKGSDSGHDIIVICAHYDSVWQGPGAFDNGGGTAGIMELARVYKEKGSKYNLRFIAFGGEEMGIWGSKAYVKRLKDKSDKIKKDKHFEKDGLKTEFDYHRFLVNLDMMGHLHGRSCAVTLGDTDIAASVRLFSKEIRYAINVRENEIYSSDNMAFNYAEIPSLSFYRCGFGDLGGHTEMDVIDNCNPAGLAHIGGFVEKWIDRYIQAMHQFPFAKTIPEAGKTAVQKWFGERNPLEYKVEGSEKRYKDKKKKKK